MVLCIHEKVVKSDIALMWPQSLLLGPLRCLLMLTPQSREERHLRKGRASIAKQKGGPSWGTGRSLGWEKTSWETWQVSIHLPLWNLLKKKKKKVEMPSPFEGKRVLLLYKAASLCFDTPLFELSSLAGRVSDSPAVGHSVCGERSCETPSPCVESKLSVSGWLCEAQHDRTSSGPGFISALYWRQTFTNKEKEKKNVLRETTFFWQEYYLTILAY